MQNEIQEFISYMREVKNAATNTVVSYERDLQKMRRYMEEQGIHASDKVTFTALNTYILYLEGEGMSTATISRTVAALRRFFDYQCKHGSCEKDPSEMLKAPRVVKKATRTITNDELERLLAIETIAPKQLRDRAMILAICQGVRASEIISLKLADVNLDMGYLVLRGERQTRTVSINDTVKQALSDYLERGRQYLLRGKNCQELFVNCNGGHLSRQGVWKVVKFYGQKIGIPELTPDGLRMPVSAEA